MVFGRACGTTLTTLNAKKISLSSTGCSYQSSCLRLTRNCPDAPEAFWMRQTLPGRSQEAACTLQRLSGRDNWQRRRCPDAHKRLPGRCRGCLEATIGGLDPPEASKIAPEPTQRTPRRALRASGRSWRPLKNEKPQKHCGLAPWSEIRQPCVRPNRA